MKTLITTLLLLFTLTSHADISIFTGTTSGAIFDLGSDRLKGEAIIFDNHTFGLSIKYKVNNTWFGVSRQMVNISKTNYSENWLKPTLSNYPTTTMIFAEYNFNNGIFLRATHMPKTTITTTFIETKQLDNGNIQFFRDKNISLSKSFLWLGYKW